ncbi:MAG: TonB-dependent receptor [Selenomonadaceae bacterium]|nr:TonB-dependent receptor [Selenomonadaceae bacterium]
MISKRLRRAILSLLVVGYIIAPPPPVIHAQNPVSVDSQEIDVESRESNEDFLNYLELIDNFVTAERIPTNRWDTPANVTVITSQEIEDNHYQTVAEALSHVNGVVIGGSDGVTTSGYITMNVGQSVLLLIDGHRANHGQEFTSLSLSDLSLIPSIKIVDRIEIVKGGYSALYGSEAVGGVVNIITKKGVRNETEVDVNYGSWKRQNYEITNQGLKGKLSWFVTAGFGKSDPFKYNAAPTNNALYSQTDYKDRDFAIRLDDQFDDRRSLTVSYFHRSHDFINETLYRMYNNASVEYRFKEDTKTPGWIRYVNNYVTAPEGYSDTSKLQSLEYQNGWELGDRHALIAGIEFHRNELSYSMLGIEDAKLNSQAAYLQDTFKLTDKWTLVPGVRFDHRKDYGHQWSPKFATNYRADDKTRFFISYGRVYQAPTLTQLYADNESNDYAQVLILGGYWLKNNPDFSTLLGRDLTNFRAEKGHTEMLGFEHNFDDNSNVSMTLFNTRLNDVVSYYTTQPVFYNPVTNLYISGMFIDNSSVEKNRGIDLTFRQRVNDDWSYDLGYTHTSYELLNTANNSTRSDHAQPNGYRVGVHYRHGAWKANLLGIMASGLDSQYFPSSSYAVLDLNASYDINDRATVYFRTLNFTDEDYRTYGSTSGDERSPGRFFQIGATYKF